MPTISGGHPDFDERGNPQPRDPAFAGPGDLPDQAWLDSYWFDGEPVTWPGQQPSAKQEMEVAG
jgi:hypothetical protein